MVALWAAVTFAACGGGSKPCATSLVTKGSRAGGLYRTVGHMLSDP
jgi:hypothetical protein